METIADLFKKRFPEPTAIQKKAMPALLQGKNALLVAPTGSGKTEAALLPVLEMVHGKPGISALYITPLRALNRDMKKRMDWWCEQAGITHAVRHGDTSVSERGKQRASPPQLLIVTPETLQALLVGRVMRAHLSNVKHVIVEEVHELMNNKRGTQLSMGLERLAEVAEFQRIGLSATIARPKEAGKLICGAREFSVIEAGASREIDLEIVKAYGGEKKVFEKVKDILEKGQVKRRIIFVNTRSTAEGLATYLDMEKVPIDIHHGSLSAEVRLKTEEGLKGGETKTVVATSSLELGIDIGDMEEIIQFNSPREVARLVQRVGRSGHAMHLRPSGKIVVGDYDEWMEARAIKDEFENGFLEEREVVRGAMDVAAHQFVGLLLDKGRINVDDAYTILNRAYAFALKPDEFKRVVKQLDRERLIFLNPDNTSAIRQAGREYYFYNLTTIPKERKYMLRDAGTNRIVASLDERFVANLAPGEFFSSRGKVWRMIELTSELLAEQAASADFVIPDWVGEDIPVHREVAQEVGRLRGADEEKHGEKMVPDEKKILVEIAKESVVLHSCFGTRINYTLGRVLQLRLAKKLGAEVAVATDPYRVMLRLPFPAKKEWIDAALVPYDLEFDAEESLWNSSALRLVFLHTGRMFGMFGEDAMVGTKLIRLMVDTPVYEETVNSIFRKYFDLEGAKRLLLGIMKKEPALVFEEREKLSFFAMVGIKRKEEGVPSIQPREAMLKSIREELEKKKITLHCLSCGAERLTTVANAPENFKCHGCGRTSLTVWPGAPEELAAKAAILRAYGKRGLLALSVFGVGPKTADRILSKLHKDEDLLLLDLLEAQKNFIKNKKYWRA
ncbi:MAG: DEAD/DEAH box helicase [Candidatus ainarchaeum sp.]|nr:DEAD/DEAH box helicase [Candidatus ainarchaeum sp.]